MNAGVRKRSGDVHTVHLDFLAVVSQLGIPTWFLTFSAADMQWAEMIQSITTSVWKVPDGCQKHAMGRKMSASVSSKNSLEENKPNQQTPGLHDQN